MADTHIPNEPARKRAVLYRRSETVKPQNKPNKLLAECLKKFKYVFKPNLVCKKKNLQTTISGSGQAKMSIKNDRLLI